MNTTKLWLKIELQSDAAIGRGDGVAGLVNAEIKHDAIGLPYISGKTLKGLLVAQCAEILFSLRQISINIDPWESAAGRLFGQSGSRQSETGKLRVENACLPPDLRANLAKEFDLIQLTQNTQDRQRKWGLQRTACLEAVTALRRQTAIQPRTGAPLRNSLRTMRVLLRTTPLIAELDVRPSLELSEMALLAACVSTFRRLGSSRNRGLGAIQADLYNSPMFDLLTNAPTGAAPVTSEWLQTFEQEVR